MEHLTESHQYVVMLIDKIFGGLSTLYGVWALHRSIPSKKDTALVQQKEGS